MIELFELSIYYGLFVIAVYLASKVLIVVLIWKKITIRKTRNILLTLALLFSPTLTTVGWVINWRNYTLYLFELPVLALIADLGILEWMRAIFEPLEALDDMEYSADITNVDIP
jgi:hypothetical protein